MILKGIGYLFIGASVLAILCIFSADLLGAFILAGVGLALFLTGLWIYDKGENIKQRAKGKKKRRS